VQDVRTALATMAVTYSTPTLQKAHNCLTRALRHIVNQAQQQKTKADPGI